MVMSHWITKIYLYIYNALLSVLDQICGLFGVTPWPIDLDYILKGLSSDVKKEATDFGMVQPLDCILKDIRCGRDRGLAERIELVTSHREHLHVRMEIRKALQQFPGVQQDDRFFAPMMWELLRPAPIHTKGGFSEAPGRKANWRDSPRYKVGAKKMADYMATFDRNHSHEFSAEQPEECYAMFYRYYLGYEEMLLDQDMKRWRKWFYDLTPEDMANIYQEHKKQLQLIGHQALEGRRYLLKDCLHLLSLDAALETYPDAKFIFSHRRLSEAVPSLASLFRALLPEGTAPDAEYGQRITHFVGTLAQRFVDTLQRLCKADKDRIIQYSYRDMLRDPMRVIHTVYNHLGMTLTSEVVVRMSEYLSRNPQHRHGKHAYSMAQFDISQTDIEREFDGFLKYCQANGMTRRDFL